MLDFVKSNIGYILAIISCFATVISFIFKNKSNKINSKIFRVIQVLPIIINEAESIFKDVVKSGENKLAYVLNRLEVLCTEVNLPFDDDFWNDKIEAFLSTPQKNK